MKEIINHEIYELLKEQYERVCLDYVILECETEYEGNKTHKQAIIEAFNVLNRRYSDSDCVFDIYPEKMSAEKSDIDELLKLPEDDYYETRPDIDRTYDIPSPLPYWFAFLEPPHGTPYLTSDFIAFNDVLFKNKDELEAYRWNDAFSNYFDAGKEWWGTGLWSVYDKKSSTIVIIGASLTD